MDTIAVDLKARILYNALTERRAETPVKGMEVDRQGGRSEDNTIDVGSSTDLQVALFFNYKTFE